MSRRTRFFHTPEHVEFIKENSAGLSRADTLMRFNKEFGVNISDDQLGQIMHKHRIYNGTNGKFPRGKEQRAYTAEIFKRVRVCHPVGTEVVNGNGFIKVKIAGPNVWKLKHIMVWENANGPVPIGHIVIFGDGNKLNTCLENLVLVSKRQMAVMNGRGLKGHDAESMKVCANLASLYLSFTDREKGGKAVIDRKT